MNKPTMKKIQDWFDGYGRDEYRPRNPMRSGSYNEEMREAIRALILSRKVSRAFVEKYECAWKHWQHQSKRERDKPKRLILAMLTELGHEVEVR